MVADWDQMALVGYIARAHGNRGQVIVDPETDFPEERYRSGSILFRRRDEDSTIEPLTIISVRFHRGRPIVGFEGVDTMNASEEVSGSELSVTTDAVQP